MEFFYDLYNSENFVIYLFITIAVLTAIFLILIFSGRKTDKKNHKKETEKVDNISLDNSVTSDSNQSIGVSNVALNNEVIPIKNDEPIVTNAPISEPIITEPVVNEPILESSSENVVIEEKPIIDPFNSSEISFTPVKEELNPIIENSDNSNMVLDNVINSGINITEKPVEQINPVIEAEPIIKTEPLMDLNNTLVLNPIETKPLEVPTQEAIETKPLEVPTQETVQVQLPKEEIIQDDDLPKLKEENNPLDINETYRV